MDKHRIHHRQIAVYGWRDTIGRHGWLKYCTVCDWEEFYDSEAE